jgi:DnaJ-class molecular chaperone
MKDLYKILDVEKNAGQPEIKKAYRNLAKKYHPDKNQDRPEIIEKFKEVNSAFEILGDSEKRKMYDEFGEMSTKPGFDPQNARQYANSRSGVNWGSNRNSSFHDQDDFLSFIFGDIFSNFRQPGRANFKAEDTNANVKLDFLQAIRGDLVEINIPSKGECPACHGRNQHNHCYICNNSGLINIDKTLKVRIPPGATNGKKIRLKGHGETGKQGGMPGDLILTIGVNLHPYFQRKEDNVHLEVPITIEKAMFGSKLSLETPLGKSVKITIPKGSQGGTVLRVRGHGVQKKDGTKGDFIIHLTLILPSKIEKNMEKAAKTLSKGVNLELPDGINYL